MLYAVNGLYAAYPQLDVPGVLNDTGDAAFAATQGQCTAETVANCAFVPVVHSTLDDIVPYAQGRAMARSWCARGARVRFDTSVALTHLGAAATAFPAAFSWLEARFAGVPAVSTCGRF
jgi:hypothetical protein